MGRSVPPRSPKDSNVVYFVPEVHEVSNVLFEDCDIIHNEGRETALHVHHCHDGLVQEISLYEMAQLG
ncbi:MAG: hypothetical protein ABJN84_04240 [Flavobacteriaceae bacterium]